MARAKDTSESVEAPPKQSAGEKLVAEMQPAAEEAPVVEEPVAEPADEPVVEEPDGAVGDVPVETPEAEQQPWYSQLSELGFEGVESDDDAHSRVLAALRDQREQQEQIRAENERLQSFMGYGQQYLALQSDPSYQEWLKSRQQPQPEAAVEKPSAWWAPPEFNQDVAKKYWRPKVDAQTGETAYGWAEDTPADVRVAAEKYNAYLDDWATKLQTRPHEALPPVIGQTVAQAIDSGDSAVVEALNRFLERRLSEQDQKREQETFIDQVTRENASWLYQVDPVTNAQKRDREGRPLLSPEGRRVMDYVSEAEEIGISDLRRQWDYATRMARLESLTAAQGGQQKQQQSQATREQKQREHLKRAATSVPDRSGGIVNGTSTTPSPRAKWEDVLRQELVQNGVFSNAS